jgi:hypothetical protein
MEQNSGDKKKYFIAHTEEYSHTCEMFYLGEETSIK